MADSDYSSVTYSDIADLPNGFSLLFTTSDIYRAVPVVSGGNSPLANLAVLFDSYVLSHEASGGVTTFTYDGVPLTYNGIIDSLTSVAIVYNASESKISLYVGGELSSEADYIKGAITGGNVKLQGTRIWNISDLRIYKKALSAGAIEYYNLDAEKSGLALGRLG